ncbi:iron-containing alcohol dehydrogenase family protein [Limisphaera sp. VF-2]|jgi:alcohol dehydrogenase class IV|uniref:iron-containing alcohol dehydrogenase family protein n=1 Tax=Limisphaera sp. VF-2 TaxID=3400418 RepID=UPI001772218E
MHTVTIHQVPVLQVGEGCAEAAGAWLVGRGCRRALAVSGRSVRPVLERLCDRWHREGLETVVLPPVPAEPTVRQYEELWREARRHEVDAVLGLGGGSVLDVAKLLAALLKRDEPVTEFFGIDRLPGRGLMLVCVPTTAGTGSEVSPNAILLDETVWLKQGVISRYLVPDAAFVDPELTYSVPPPVTAATGFDALTHCIEAYANRRAHPWVDMWALQGIRWIGAHLLRAVQDGRDREARRFVALGSLCGGLCLGPVNTAAVHALAYPLGGRFRVPHGVANAVLLPHVLRYNLEAALDRYAEVARALGVPAGRDERSTAAEGLARLEDLSRACGLPRGLSALGVRREDLPGMARAALQVQRLLRNNPRSLEEGDILAIYEAAF